MEAVSFECLDKAIATRLPVALAGIAGDKSVEIAAKFVVESSDDAQPGIWIQPTTSSPANSKLYEQLAAEKTPLTATFCDAGSKVLFQTAIAFRNKHYWLNDRIVFEALLIETPSELSTPEFRGGRRYRISDKGGIQGKLFRREGAVSKEIEATLWDLSRGGISFVCPMDKQLQNLPANEVFVAMLNFRGKRITMPARFAHARPLSSRTLRVGMRFDFSNPATESMKDDLERMCKELEAERK